MQQLKKIKAALAIIAALLMSGCAKQNAPESQEISEGTAVSTTAKIETIKASVKENADETSNTEIVKADAQKSYTEAKELIGSYTNKYISMNSEEKSIYSKDEDVSSYSSEGGSLTKFYDENDNLLRCRLDLYGSMGKAEQNYYYIDDQHGYYTVLSGTYDTSPLTQADLDTLYYVFLEYWFDNDKIYYIDNVNGALVECHINPIPEPMPDHISAE